jgi:hypothetical protein
MFARLATCVSSRLRSTYWPFPERSRHKSDAMMAPDACTPVTTSVIATPTLTGSRPSSPVIHISPPTAESTMS